jgi:hypothetical protein
MMVAKLNYRSFTEYAADGRKRFCRCTITTCVNMHFTINPQKIQCCARTQAQRHFRIKQHGTLPKTVGTYLKQKQPKEFGSVLRKRSEGHPNVANKNAQHILHVSVLRTGQHELWTAHICGDRDDSPTVVEIEFMVINRVFGQTSSLLQMTPK